MWDKIADGQAALLEAIVLGALLSLLYDVFRIRRAVVTLPHAVVFIEDIFYCLVAALSFFLVLMDVGNGSVRWFLVIGCIAGWLSCHLTIGFALLVVTQLLLRFLRLMLYAFLRLFVRPIWLFVRKIVNMCRTRRDNRKNVQKSLQKT